MKQEFFAFVWNSDVTHKLRRCQVPKRNSCNAGTSFCCFLRRSTEANQSKRIIALQPSEMLFAVLDSSNSNKQRRLFLFRLDHDDVPIS